MKFGIMGAGAVGCYYGALLAKAGHDVTLVGRQAFVDQVGARGIQLEMGGNRTAIPVHASTRPEALAECDIVLFAVKSGDTESAGRALAPHLKPDAMILSFQNGVDNAERLAAVLGRAVVPVAVYVATEMAGPGHVKHNGRGDIVIGPSTGSSRLAEAFEAAGIPTRVSGAVIEALWQKLIINCAYNALSALSKLPYGVLLEAEGVKDVMRDVTAECIAVARASGVALPDPDFDAIFSLARTMPGQYSSTAQDLARGRPTEIDHLNGHILLRGHEAGIATPANRLLHTLVKLAESKSGAGVPLPS
ncbi:ketopantoate reductase family protein [Rhizobium sp.]